MISNRFTQKVTVDGSGEMGDNLTAIDL